MSRQRLGQHFLVDPAWRARILSTLGVRGGHLWLEIGAGHGEMTQELARRAGRVIAVELDPRLVARLHTLAREWPNLEVVAGDVLQLDLAALAGRERFRVYGNLPYYITSPILHRLLQAADRIEAIHIVVQLEVAARLVARPRHREYGYLSVLAQFYSRPQIRLRIPSGAFRPRPKVASALVAMELGGATEPPPRTTLGVDDEARFLKFVQASFAQKRKTLLNNLRSVVPAKQAQALVAAAGLGPKARAEELTLEQFAALFRRFSRVSSE